jgi:hypothetical protein
MMGPVRNGPEMTIGLAMHDQGVRFITFGCVNNHNLHTALDGGPSSTGSLNDILVSET